MTAGDSAPTPLLRPRLVQPRWFALPFVGLTLFVLSFSLESTRRTERWASLCFLVCTLLLFHRRLPPLLPPGHPAERRDGECWREVCDVLAAESLAGY